MGKALLVPGKREVTSGQVCLLVCESRGHCSWDTWAASSDPPLCDCTHSDVQCGFLVAGFWKKTAFEVVLVP